MSSHGLSSVGMQTGSGHGGGEEREKARDSSGVSPSPIRTPVPLDQGSTLMTSSYSNYPLKDASSDTITVGLGLHHMDFGGTQFSS